MLTLLSTVGGAVLATMSGASAFALDAVVPADAAGGSPQLASTAAAAAAAAAAPPPDDATKAPTSEVVITGTVQRDNAISNIPVPVIETTQSVHVMTTDDLHLASVTRFMDVARLDSGTYSPGSRAGYSQLYYRGFISSYPDFPLRIDGFRQDTTVIPDFYLYDSIQVYLGSAATNYGSTSPGGVEVVVSKTPKDHFGAEAAAYAGSYDNYGVNFDVYGPITPDGKVTARFIGVASTERSAFDYLGDKKWSLGPSLRWKPTEHDEVLFIGQFSQDNAGASVGFGLALNSAGPGGAANGNNYRIPDVKKSQLGDDAPWARLDKNFYNMSLTYTHTFSGGFADGWKLKMGAEHYDINTPTEKWAWVGGFGGGEIVSTDKTKPTSVYVYWAAVKNHQWAGEVNLLGSFQALGHTQNFSIGGDYTLQNLGFHPLLLQDVPGSKSGFNIYQNNWQALPGYSSPEQLIAQYGEGFNFFRNQRTINYGEEGQLLLHPIDRLTINGGFRISYSEQAIAATATYPTTASLDQTPYLPAYPQQHDWTYQVGGSYELIPHINGYVSYGTTYEPGNAFGYDPLHPTGIGNYLGNILGRTYEAGLKGEAASHAYTWSFDVYDTAVTNAFQTDPQHIRYSKVIGAEQAQGWEFNFKGSIAPGWFLLVSSSSGWNTFTGGPLKGFTSPFVAKFGLSAFTTYEIQSGRFKGLGIGGGVVYKTMPTPTTYSYASDGSVSFVNYKAAFRSHQTEVDMRVFYNAAPWKYELSASNVFDQRYASPRFLNQVEFEVFENQPTLVMARVSRSFQ